MLIVEIRRMLYGVYTSGMISNIFANLKSFICALCFSFHSCLIFHVVQNSLFYNLIVRLGKLKLKMNNTSQEEEQKYFMVTHYSIN